MRGRRSRLGIALALTALAVLVDAATAGATGATFSITPTTRAPYFVFRGTPGSVIRGQVRVVNVSGVAGRAQLYAVDATTGQTSGAVYKSHGAPRRGVGAWIRLAAGTVALGPHQGARVSFSVTVPRSAPGGQHLGGLVVAPVKPTSTSTTKRGSHTFHVNIEEIAVVAVQVNLPGPVRRRVAITGVQAAGRPGYQTLLIGLGNRGNALVKGSGKIVVFHAGRQVLARSFSLDTLVPHTHIQFPVYVRGRRLGPGRYIAEVTVPYTGRHVAHGKFAFAISTKQLRQTYGTTAPPGLGGGPAHDSSSVPAWAIVLGGIALLGAGVGISSLFFLFMRRRSASAEQRQG